jgi:hypothetical protein
VTLWAASYAESEGSVFAVGFVGFLMLITYVGAVYGLECANALLDTSPRVREPVLIRRLSRVQGKTIRGGSLEAVATISPVDQPTRQFELDWGSCKVKWSTPVSPYAAVRVGRGAFGIPWVDLPVECRPLAISDRPLVGDFVLGRAPAVVVILRPERPRGASAGHAERLQGLFMHLDELKEGRGDPAEIANLLMFDGQAVLSADGQAAFFGIVAPLAHGATAKSEDVVRAAERVVEADEQSLNAGYRFSIWRKAIEAAAPGLPIVVIESPLEKTNRATLPCPRCTFVSADDVDKEIFGLFTGRSHPEFDNEQVFLADRAGKLAFTAGLSDIAQAPELAARAKAVLAGN